MNKDDRTKVEQAIGLLQELLGQKKAVGSKAADIPSSAEFDEKLGTFLKLGEKLQPEIVQLSKAIEKAFALMKRYVAFAAGAKKPEGAVSEKLMAAFKAELQPTIELEKSDKWKDYAKAMKQAGSAAFWVFVPEPKAQIENCLQSADYDANRFRKNKTPGHNEWYGALQNTLKSLMNYTADNYSSGVSYDRDGTGDWNTFLSNDKTRQAPSAEKPVSAPVAVKKEEPAVPAPAVKPPVRELKPPNNWFVQNFNNEVITFTEEQAQMKNTIFIENSKKIQVNISKSKIKNVMVSKVEGLVLLLKDCVSGVQIMNCKNVQVRVSGWCPSISIDGSTAVSIILSNDNKNTDIVSSKTNQLNIAYSLPEGEQSKEYAVCDQFITRWNEKLEKFETKVYSQFM